MPTIVEILEAHGVSYRAGGTHHHVRASWVGVDCPRCSPGTGRYRAAFSLDGRRANCWTCGRADVAALLAAVCRLPLGAAITLREGLTGGRGPAVKPLRGIYRPPHNAAGLLPAHNAYLRRRGFDPAEIERVWDIGGIGPGSSLPWRLFIPIKDEQGHNVTWTTRTINEERRDRYISAPAEHEEVSIKETLYGLHLARHAVVIVEGPTDAWALGPGAAATCGTGYTPAQAALAAGFPLRAVCFDTEPAAQRRAEQLCRDLAAMPGRTTNIVLETGKDPASADKAELVEIRREFLGDSC